MPEKISESINRIDAAAKVTGQAKYPGDINLPNQAFMKTVFSDRAHALIRRIDSIEAQKLPGVLAVLTARDVPCNEYGLITNDQPVLCGPGSGKSYADRVRFIGDQIALVIAETRDIAEAASRLIKIDYEDLEILNDPLEAMQENAILLHPHNGSNILCRKQISLGDIEAAFNSADVVISSEYHTPAQEHLFLQPEAGVSYVDENGRVHVVTSGQWAHNDQNQISHALQLPKEKVHVAYAAIGGAFGGKEDISVQITLALSALYLHKKGIHRPVKTVWNREESFLGHPKRHPFIIRAKWGAKKSGKIIAAEMEIIADCGAYASSSEAVLSSAAILSIGPYQIPNVKIEAAAVYTNHIPNGAFRGFGSPQVTFASESQINKLSEKLGIDPVEIRMRNIIKEGGLSAVGTPLPAGISIEKVISTCAVNAGWALTESGWKLVNQEPEKTKPGQNRRIGLGFSAGYKSFGIPPDSSSVAIELYGSASIEKAVVKFAGADMGQGAHSVYAQFAAQALDLPIKAIEVISSDTDLTDDAGSASASRLTYMSGNSIIQAARIALEAWRQEQRPAVGKFQYRPLQGTDRKKFGGKNHPNYGYGYVAEAVKAEVDEATGKITILEVVCANDVGKAVNPMQVKGQIEGAVVQAMGYGLLEDIKYENCSMLTKSMATYLIPTIMDIPQKLNAIILEEPDPNGPLGARGMAEMPYISFAPALTSAIHAACGVWVDALPLTPEINFGKYRKTITTYEKL